MFITSIMISGVILSFVLHLLLNYYFYYKGQEGWFKSDVNLITTSISYIAKIIINKGEVQLKNNLEEFIKQSQRNISISRIAPTGDIEWTIPKKHYSDVSKTILRSYKELDIGEVKLGIDISKLNRPPAYLQLFRAVSFSMLDFIENPTNYEEYGLIWRTIPWLVSLFIRWSLVQPQRGSPIFPRGYG